MKMIIVHDELGRPRIIGRPFNTGPVPSVDGNNQPRRTKCELIFSERERLEVQETAAEIARRLSLDDMGFFR